MSEPHSSPDRDLDQRLSKVESLVTFIERKADDLGDVLLQLHRRIDVQEEELAQLRARFETLNDSIVEMPRQPEDEKPPHY